MIEIIECNPLFPLKLAISVNDFWAASLRWRDLEQVERVRSGGGEAGGFLFYNNQTKQHENPQNVDFSGQIPHAS